MVTNPHLLGDSGRRAAATLLLLGLVVVVVGTVRIGRVLGRLRSVPDVPGSSHVSTEVLAWAVAVIICFIVALWHLRR